MLKALCQEGSDITGGTAELSCTMPDGSVWTCVRTNGPFGPSDNFDCKKEDCKKEGSAGPRGPQEAPAPPPPAQQQAISPCCGPHASPAATRWSSTAGAIGTTPTTRPVSWRSCRRGRCCTATPTPTHPARRRAACTTAWFSQS